MDDVVIAVIDGKYPVDDRFWSKVDASGDCWEWTAATAGRGYGHLVVAGVDRYAHRVAWEMLVGPIPEGLQLDHLCRNIRCVNPDHLEPVTRQENIRRAFPRRGVNHRNAQKTHCKRGHLLAGSNLVPAEHRYCRECRNLRDRREYRLQRAAS